MRCSFCAVAAAILLSISTVFAGGAAANHLAFRNSSASHMRAASIGCSCETCDSPVTTCDSACGSTCGTCRPACPRILPMLVSGLDCMLQRLYYNPCNVPCCRPNPCRSTCCTDIWQGYSSRSGCDSGCTGTWHSTTPMTPMNPTNPFKDDDIQLPPAVPKDLGIKRPTPKMQPVQHRKPKYDSAPTPAVPPVKVAEAVEPIQSVPRPAVVPRRSDRPVQQVKHETPAKRFIPKNPLRNE